MEDATNDAAAIRKNMARLRELRLAKEAKDAEAAPKDGVAAKARPVKPSNRKRIIRK